MSQELIKMSTMKEREKDVLSINVRQRECTQEFGVMSYEQLLDKSISLFNQIQFATLCLKECLSIV